MPVISTAGPAGTIGISQGTAVEAGEFTGEEKPALAKVTWKNLVAGDARLRAGAPGLADSVAAVGADSAPARSMTATRLAGALIRQEAGTIVSAA